MSTHSRTTSISALLLAFSLAASVFVVQQTDKVRENATLEEVLYIPSANTLQKMSLGYRGLLADIYWTRVVQYFGNKHHENSMQYQLLKPLLDITTTLDPQLIPAYEFGAIFLSQKPPEGAGDPHAAVDLVRSGIARNPEAWRLYYNLGFIYWVELKDPVSAAEAFRQGAQVPGALPWMSVMAAALSAHAGQAETAEYLWKNIYNSTQDEHLRANALKRLACLRVDKEVTLLESMVERYRQQHDMWPRTWNDLIASGFLRGVPTDPAQRPYVLRYGRVYVSDPDKFPFITRGLPEGQQPSDLRGLNR